jgi:hypothetical protein
MLAASPVPLGLVSAPHGGRLTDPPEGDGQRALIPNVPYAFVST